MIFRSLQFSVYEGFVTKAEDWDGLKHTLPGTEVQYKIVLGGLISGSTRAVLECPFEYAKVKRQTGQSWVFKDVYKGFSNLYIRSAGLLTYAFIMMDVTRRNTSLWTTKTGQFFISGTIATTAFWICWPFELLKNMAQADNVEAGRTSRERVKFIYKHHGIAGFYRGILPGTQSIFLRNGASMVVMQYANKQFTKRGWRD